MSCSLFVEHPWSACHVLTAVYFSIFPGSRIFEASLLTDSGGGDGLLQ